MTLFILDTFIRDPPLATLLIWETLTNCTGMTRVRPEVSTSLTLKTQELEFVENPNKMFHKLYYNEKEKRLINHHKFGGSYVKIIVEGKSTPSPSHPVGGQSLLKAGVQDVKIIENFDISVTDDTEVEAEDTLTTLTNYVMAMEDEHNKENIINIFKSLYVEAQEV